MRRFLLPLIIILIAIGIMAALILLRPQPEQRVAKRQGYLVETVTVHLRPHQLQVAAAGTVRPAQTVTLQPQIAGRLSWVNANLVPGGLVAAGEHLATIEEDDYRLAVASLESDYTEALANLQLEQGQQNVAEKEWQFFADNGNPPPGTKKYLATRQPQLAIARARVEKTAALLEQARLDLRRAKLQAPFAAVVSQEDAAVGQLVSSQTQVAVLLAVDLFWVEAAVPVEFLPFIDIPGLNGAQGAAAVISHDYGRERLTMTGQVYQLLPEIDPAGRMARLLIKVADPFHLQGQTSQSLSENQMPLLAGAYVDIEIRGPSRRDLLEVPRIALHNGNTVYIMSPAQTLRIREVDIFWERRDHVLVQAGLADGEQVIVSRIAAPVPGMALRREEEKENVAHDGD